MKTKNTGFKKMEKKAEKAELGKKMPESKMKAEGAKPKKMKRGK